MPDKDVITRFSDFVDTHLFTIRPLLTLCCIGSASFLVVRSKWGKKYKRVEDIPNRLFYDPQPRKQFHHLDGLFKVKPALLSENNTASSMEIRFEHVSPLRRFLLGAPTRKLKLSSNARNE